MTEAQKYIDSVEGDAHMSAVEIIEKLDEELKIYQLGFRLARRALVRDKIGFQDAVLTGEQLAAELNSFKNDIYKLVIK